MLGIVARCMGQIHPTLDVWNLWTTLLHNPASTSTMGVTVVTVGGTSPTSTFERFSYVAVASATGSSLKSDTAVAGATVTIMDANLANATSVDFGTIGVYAPINSQLVTWTVVSESVPLATGVSAIVQGYGNINTGSNGTMAGVMSDFWYWTTQPVTSPDSQDAYAATFLSMSWKYVEAGGNLCVLQSPGVRRKYEQVAQVILTLQDPSDGLTWAKVEYLVDNGEVYAGLQAMANLEATTFHGNVSLAAVRFVVPDADITLDACKRLWMAALDWALQLNRTLRRWLEGKSMLLTLEATPIQYTLSQGEKMRVLLQSHEVIDQILTNTTPSSHPKWQDRYREHIDHLCADVFWVLIPCPASEASRTEKRRFHDNPKGTTGSLRATLGNRSEGRPCFVAYQD